MAERANFAEQLNAALEAMMANPSGPLPSTDPRLRELLEIASELSHRPAPDFKLRLKEDLQKESPRPAVSPIPEGYHTATPCLVIRDAARALDFYREAFDATELVRHADASGKILHAEFQVGDSRIAIADEMPEWGNLSPQALGGSPVVLSLYVEDVDTLAPQAIAAGAQVLFPLSDQFYGDRTCRLADPFGHVWILATHKEDVSAEELQRRSEAWEREQEKAAPTPTPDISYRVEPHLAVRGASGLIDFLAEAFGAEERSRHTEADGTILHAALEIGGSTLTTGDSSPSPSAIHLYVPDADAAYERALRAGATSMYAPTDQDYGDREAAVRDAYGNNWYIGTHKGPRDAPDAGAHIPPGLQAVNSYLHPHGASALIDFFKRAFGAEEAFRAEAADGSVAHAKIRIGESVVEMGEAHPAFPPMAAIYHLYVNHVDEAYRRAIDAGGVSLSEPADQSWGNRSAGVRDPAGNQWWINAPLAPAQEVVREESRADDSLTPFLFVREVQKTVDFLKAAFGAELLLLDRGGDPPHDHAELRIGTSLMMMGEAVTGYPATTSAFYLRVPDVDGAYEQALRAGAVSKQPPEDMPWGHRMAHVADPLGNSWFIAGKTGG